MHTAFASISPFTSHLGFQQGIDNTKCSHYEVTLEFVMRSAMLARDLMAQVETL